MSEEAVDNVATEGTWAIPMLVLFPSGLIVIITDLGVPWLVGAWICIGLAGLLIATGWIQAVRNGIRRATGWATCAAVHLVLAWQVARLLA
ncbi:hypothetical protein ACIPW5_00070 [Streptomyces sp. NPDC090077]|uniref:hypothetical protein n=1 Tax=Streptomyces sp. NPDC090077 TaxID=3365938 RepID=UPI003825925A